jgi:hypothetical protein
VGCFSSRLIRRLPMADLDSIRDVARGGVADRRASGAVTSPLWNKTVPEVDIAAGVTQAQGARLAGKEGA